MPDSCVKCDRTATRQLQCTACKGRWPVCRYCRTVPAVKKNCLCSDDGQFTAPAKIDPASLDPWLTIAEQDDDDDDDDQTATDIVSPPSPPQQVSVSSSQTPPSSPTKASQTPMMPVTPQTSTAPVTPMTPVTPVTPVNANTTSTPSTPLKSPARRPGSALQNLTALGQESALSPHSPFRGKKPPSSPPNVNSNQPSSSSAPASPSQTRIDASVQRGLTGTSLGPPLLRPDELRILSWNVQNFTADRRLGTQRGDLDSPENGKRIAIIAEVMNKNQVDALLLMETGSDVSTVLREIGKQLVLNGDLSYEPLVSEETHGVPTLELKYKIEPGAITARHVDALRNASEAFSVTVDGLPAARAEAEAWKVWQRVRKSIPEPPQSDWLQVCRQEIVNLIEELEQATDQEANEFAQDLKATTYDDSPPSLIRLRADRSYAAAAFHGQPQLEKLTAFLELLEILLLLEFMKTSQLLDLEMVASLADRRPISCAVLVARRTIVLRRLKETDDIYSSENVKFVYDALRVLGCVEFYSETYGCAMRMDREQLERTFTNEELGAPVIERYDEQGALLPLQTPRSAVNWRSAVRMRLFLPNQGPDILVYLFHTRFCFDATDLKTANGKSQAEKKIVLRCQSIGTITEVAKNNAGLSGTPRPRMVLGDFNVPAYPPAFQDAAAAWQAAAGDYTQLPDPAPRTTLRSPGSFLSETGAALRDQKPVDPASWYSEPYDRVLFHGEGALDCKCTALRVPDILPALDAERFVAVQAYYARCVGKIMKVLNELRDYVQQATKRRAGKQIDQGDPAYEPLFGAQTEIRKRLDDRGTAMSTATRDQVPQPDPQDLAKFLDDLARNDTKLPASFQKNVEAFADDIEYLFNQMLAIEQNAEARLHLAYARLVSDHVPLLLTITKKQSS